MNGKPVKNECEVQVFTSRGSFVKTTCFPLNSKVLSIKINLSSDDPSNVYKMSQVHLVTYLLELYFTTYSNDHYILTPSAKVLFSTESLCHLF